MTGGRQLNSDGITVTRDHLGKLVMSLDETLGAGDVKHIYHTWRPAPFALRSSARLELKQSRLPRLKHLLQLHQPAHLAGRALAG